MLSCHKPQKQFQQYNSPHRYEPAGGRDYRDERIRVGHDDRRRAEDDRRRAESSRSGHRDRREGSVPNLLSLMDSFLSLDHFQRGVGVPPETSSVAAHRRAAAEWAGYPPAGRDPQHRYG